jgi:predicted nucleic acid-binding protein
MRSDGCVMPGKTERIYWDACVFLSYINGDDGRVDVIQQLLDEATGGAFELVTSTVSQVEVAFGKAEQEGGTTDQDTLDKIEALWVPDSPVKLIEFHRLIAKDARDLVRAARLDGRKLTPLDAVHLASAARLGVTEFQTYDGKLLGFTGTSFKIVEPWTPTPRLPGV